MSDFKGRLKQLSAHSSQLGFDTLIRGIEKENLRVNTHGHIASSVHPTALGSSLCNPFITTDFAESLVEVITKPYRKISQTYTELNAITAFVNSVLEGEYLWPYSMPSFINADDDIIIANYGASNLGTMKTLYRQGLSHRYGNIMQVIAGIHYNVSLPKAFLIALKQLDQEKIPDQQYISHCYMRLIRQFYGYYWVLPYLFGASPLCMKSSLIHPVDFSLKSFDDQSVYRPYATSLRLSSLGYRNKHENQLHISYESIEQYADSLLRATKQIVPEYEKIGVYKQGNYRQLSAAILQIENEYYSPIRPKRVARKFERPAYALLERGVEYIELRALDLNPLNASGMTENDMAFLEVFLSFCAILPEREENKSITYCSKSRANFSRVAISGRDPKLTLTIDDAEVPFVDAITALFDKLFAVAELMDSSIPEPFYYSAVKGQFAKVHDVRQTPSAMFLEQLKASGKTATDYIMQCAHNHHKTLNRHSLNTAKMKQFVETADESLWAQIQNEANDTQTFAQYLQHYFKVD